MEQKVVKSENDKREYRAITLENGLRALLISDLNSLEEETKDKNDLTDQEDETTDEDDYEDEEEEVEDVPKGRARGKGRGKKSKSSKKPKKMAAAALCIGHGSFSDPADIPGLAHFLEHMVFMGSEKYPEENDFDQYTKKHGGGSNAFTDCERTVFHFEVEPKAFEESLDRFAQFFIKPLMKKDSVDRELQAIDSEFNMGQMSDGNRQEQLLGTLAKEGHPMSKFFWGNLKSLKEDPEAQNICPYERLHDFYSDIYSSHYMTLAVQSTDTLDALEGYMKNIFTEVPHNGKPQQNFSDQQDPFDTEDFHKMYKVVPVKDYHQVELTWCLPPMQKHYREKPLNYLGWLIGHEGTGSILSYLKSRFWATSLHSGNSEGGFEHNTTWSQFSIGVTLTDEGMLHVFEVLCAIFEYLSIVQTVGPQEWIFREIQSVEATGFRWTEQGDAAEYVECLCENMQLYPPQDYITGDDLIFEYNPELIQRCTSMLVARKANLMIASSQYKLVDHCNLTEPWFGTRYSKEDIPEDWLKTWETCEPRSIFHLPSPNKYIATDFTLVEEEHMCENPEVISSTDLGTLWYKKDNKFKVPKAYVGFQLLTPVIGESALSQCHFDVFLQALQHELAEVAYAADVASLGYEIGGGQKGMLIGCSGFNHKLPLLFETIIDHIAEFRLTQDLLDLAVDQLGRTYSNEWIKPSVLGKDVRLQLLEERHWLTVDKRPMLAMVTLDSLGVFVAAFRSKLYTEGLIQGNITREDAKNMQTLLLDKLRCTVLPTHTVSEVRVCRMPQGETFCRMQNMNASDSNSFIVNYYQHGPASFREAVVSDLLMFLMEEPVFDMLRTRDQLGYSVGCTNHVTSGILAFSLNVSSQADKFTLESLNAHMEKFLREFEVILKKMPKEDFEMQKSALSMLKQCEDTALVDEYIRNFAEIKERTFCFNRLAREVHDLEGISKQDVLKWFRQHTISGGHARKLSIQVAGNIAPDEAMEITNGSGEHAALKNQFSANPHLVFLPMDNTSQRAITDLHAFKKKCYLFPISKI